MAPAEERVDAEAPQGHEGDVLAKKACKKAFFGLSPLKPL